MKTTKFTSSVLAIFLAAAMALTACSNNTEQPSGSTTPENSSSTTKPTDGDDADKTADGDNTDKPTDGNDTEQPSGSAILESSDKLVVIKASAAGGSLEEAMAALKTAGKLTYDGSESEYGFYLTSVNGYTPDDSANEYWAVYTTLGDYEGVSYSNSEYGTYEYDGKTLSSASYGVSGLPMVEGEIYVLVVETY